MPTEPDEQINRELGRFKAFLEGLSDVWIDPRLRAAFGLSDVVQRTLWNAWRSMDKLRGMSEPGQRRYLRRVLQNNLIDHIREATAARHDRRLDRSLEELAAQSSCRLRDALAADDSAPDASLIREERAAALLEALSQLPPRQRESLVLQRFHGWTLEQIAAHLGCTANAVAGLHAHGIQALRRLLAPRKETLDG